MSADYPAGCVGFCSRLLRIPLLLFFSSFATGVGGSIQGRTITVGLVGADSTGQAQMWRRRWQLTGREFCCQPAVPRDCQVPRPLPPPPYCQLPGFIITEVSRHCVSRETPAYQNCSLSQFERSKLASLLLYTHTHWRNTFCSQRLVGGFLFINKV